MLEDIENITGLENLNIVAAWFLGTAIVGLVIAGVWGAVRWAVGKSTGNSDNAGKGLRGIGTVVAGALLLGSIGGAVQWSSTSQRTEALMPSEAGQRSMSVDQDAPAVDCEPVEVEGETRTAVRRPTEDAHESNVEIVEDLGADAVIEDMERVNGSWVIDGDMALTHYEIRDVRWIPNGVGGDCSEDNRSAFSESELSLVIFGGRNEVGLANMYRLTYVAPEDSDGEWEHAESDFITGL